MGSVTGRGETLTAVHSTLRESFLASDHAENHQIPRSLVGISLAAVLNNERNSTSNSTVVKTLFDIIQTEESPSNHPTSNSSSGKKSWKLLKERLKLRRNTASNAVRSEVEPNPFASESLREDAGAVMEGNDDQIQRSSSMRLADALAAEREMIRFSSVPLNQEEPIRMSLMDLLEDSTENQAEIQGPENESDDNEEGAEDEDLGHHMMVEEEEKGGGALMAEMACCVCMVRHKGAAFIPCGHTFCRMCSRELWVKRGNCPLCNNSILEILDIF